MDNLLTLSGANVARVVQAAELTGMSALIARLPMHFDTVLPPGGANLSGGERQLIRLTAAVASDRPVCLLDEGLSQLDGALRARLQLSELFRDRTLIYVDHQSPA